MKATLEAVQMIQTRGPTIEFVGRLLARSQHETRGHDPMHLVFEIWETAAGALVAASTSEPTKRQGFTSTNATVIAASADEQAQHFAVMDHFQWHDRARYMVINQLGWSLTRHVD